MVHHGCDLPRALSPLSAERQLILYNETDVLNVINYSLTADDSTYVLGYNLVIKQK